MAVPLMRSYTTTGAALNVFTPSTDNVTGLTIQQLNKVIQFSIVSIIQTLQVQQHMKITS